MGPCYLGDQWTFQKYGPPLRLHVSSQEFQAFLKRKNMNAAVSRGFQVLTFTFSCSVLGKKLNKTSLGLTKTSWAAQGLSSCRLRTVVQAQERPTWLPGLDPPPYLDGS